MKKIFSFILIIATLLFLCCCSKQSSVSDTETEHETMQEKIKFTLTEEKNIDYSDFEILLDYLCNESRYYTYHMYDIDNDGVRELIIKTGTCEADYIYTFYKLNESGQHVRIGVFSASSSILYADEEKEGILCVYGKQGYQVITHIGLADYKIKTKTLVDEEITDGEYFSSNSPLSECYIKDKSLLEKNAKLVGLELEFDPDSIEQPKVDNFETVPINVNIIDMDFELFKKKLTTTIFKISPESMGGIPIVLQENQALYYTGESSPEWFIVEENRIVGYVTLPGSLMKKLFPSDDFFYIKPKFVWADDYYCCWKTANCYMIMGSLGTNEYYNESNYYDWRTEVYILTKNLSQFKYSDQLS